MSFRWEEDLRRSFQQHAASTLWCPRPKPGPIRAAIESTCSDGRADWVWATLRCSLPDNIPALSYELMQQPTCSRILAALRTKSRQPEEMVFYFAGVSRRTYRMFLDQLLDTGLVSFDKAGFMKLGPRFPTPDIEICSFEFKLKDWRRALQQARRYRSFSHRVYVVMPNTGVGRAIQHIDSFRRSNIGLIQHDSDGISNRLIVSKKRKPSCPSDHIQAIGLLWSQGEAIPARRAKSEIARLQFAK